MATSSLKHIPAELRDLVDQPPGDPSPAPAEHQGTKVGDEPTGGHEWSEIGNKILEAWVCIKSRRRQQLGLEAYNAIPAALRDAYANEYFQKLLDAHKEQLKRAADADNGHSEPSSKKLNSG